MPTEPTAASVNEKADKLVSRVHDALWAYDGQPNARDTPAQLTWERYRGEMNDLIWKLHELLRGSA